MARVTGIGGVFFAARDPRALASWYSEYLGLPLEAFGGAVPKWANDPTARTGLTVWMPVPDDGGAFAPSSSPFMINFRVDDLDAVLARLKEGGVVPEEGPRADDHGKFAWILDPEGNKIELWEPRSDSTGE